VEHLFCFANLDPFSFAKTRLRPVFINLGHLHREEINADSPDRAEQGIGCSGSINTSFLISFKQGSTRGADLANQVTFGKAPIFSPSRNNQHSDFARSINLKGNYPPFAVCFNFLEIHHNFNCTFNVKEEIFVKNEKRITSPCSIPLDRIQSFA